MRRTTSFPHAYMVADPRSSGHPGSKFSFSVNGTTLIITRTDGDEGWSWNLKLRACMPTEDIPDFTSTVYTYYGLDGEQAPKDITEACIHPSVMNIQKYAFCHCKSLVRVTIPDNVTRIESAAFYCCGSLRSIRFSRNLEFIGATAFAYCKSLKAVFLPLQIIEIILCASTD